LGEVDAPFFGAPKKEKREKSGKGTPFFAVGGFTGVGGDGFAVCGDVFFAELALCRLEVSWGIAAGVAFVYRRGLRSLCRSAPRRAAAAIGRGLLRLAASLGLRWA
jgi:hypothetical protein